MSISSWPGLIMFDLDGTLVETAPEIAESINRTLDLAGLPRLDNALIKNWIGRGTAWLFGHVLEYSTKDPHIRESDTYAHYYPLFLEIYSELSGQLSQPFDGAFVCLDSLKEKGYSLAVVTNKDRPLTERLLNQLNMNHWFDIVVAGGDTPLGKPSAQPIQLALQKAHQVADQSLFIGDSRNDVHSAKNAGVPIWVFSHGYNHGEPIEQENPDLVLHHFNDLIHCLSVHSSTLIA